ncbi:MAG: hypothetical protein IMX00_00545 [Limnochordales bacterium]|nr:hypothetical protein [Limnochordales bacterium]
MWKGLLVLAAMQRVRRVFLGMLPAGLLVLATGCSSVTIKPDIFVATRSERAHTVTVLDKSFPFDDRTVRGTYSLGFGLGEKAQTIVYIPLSRKDLPSDIDIEAIEKVFLDVSLLGTAKEDGAAAFGVYRIVKDWRQNARIPASMQPPEPPTDHYTLLMNLMSHWPLATETDPFFTFNLTCQAIPTKVTAVNQWPVIPSPSEQLLRLDLTDLAKGWLQGEPNYGIVIKPLPDRYMPLEARWSMVGDTKPRFTLLIGSPLAETGR